MYGQYKNPAGLIDSVIKGYPIGTFIFWKTKDRLRSIRDIGSQLLPEPEPEESVDYVLDGQQRLTSLYACLKGIQIKREDSSKIDDFSQIYINLASNEDEKIVSTEVESEDEDKYISILDLLTGDFTVLASYPHQYHEKLKLYKNRIESYQYPIIQVKDAPIDIATEIFTRINVGVKHYHYLRSWWQKLLISKKISIYQKSMNNLLIISSHTITKLYPMRLYCK
ncbi:DUF262 domain-containing protein [Vibrio sp. PP-XX7]